MTEAYGGRQSVEIHGLPETPGEDLKVVVVNLAKVAGVSLAINDIDVTHRVKSYKEESPKYIIVKFKSREVRDAFYYNAKKKKNLTAKDVFPELTSKCSAAVANRMIYANERLPPQRKLLRKARQELKPRGAKFIWTQKGKILVKIQLGEKEMGGVLLPIFETFEVKQDEDILVISRKLNIEASRYGTGGEVSYDQG